MDEAILIEIAQRFRMMEELAEAADLFHAERLVRLDDAMTQCDACDEQHISGCSACQKWLEASNERDKVAKLRSDLENAMESCREDMVTMQEAIRGHN